jgi:hypothetical protein
VTLDSEDAVKAALGIESWRNLSKDNVVKLAAMMPDVDKEVSLAIVAQLPTFTKFAVNALSTLERAHLSTLDSNMRSQDKAYAASQEYRDFLRRELEREDLDPEERRYLMEQLKASVDQDHAKDSENKSFIDGLMNKVALGAMVSVAATVAVLGGKIAIEKGAEDKKS